MPARVIYYWSCGLWAKGTVAGRCARRRGKLLFFRGRDEGRAQTPNPFGFALRGGGPWGRTPAQFLVRCRRVRRYTTEGVGQDRLNFPRLSGEGNRRGRQSGNEGQVGWDYPPAIEKGAHVDPGRCEEGGYHHLEDQIVDGSPRLRHVWLVPLPGQEVDLAFRLKEHNA